MVLAPYIFSGPIAAIHKASTQQAIVKVRYAIWDIFPDDLVKEADGCLPTRTVRPWNSNSTSFILPERRQSPK